MRMKILACAVVLALFGGPLFVAQADDAKSKTCCFTNPQYSGVCSVEPAENETCASILAYLNNAQAQGKTYCANTTVRGGWKQVKCEATPSGD